MDVTILIPDVVTHAVVAVSGYALHSILRRWSRRSFRGFQRWRSIQRNKRYIGPTGERVIGYIERACSYFDNNVSASILEDFPVCHDYRSSSDARQQDSVGCFRRRFG